MARSVRDLPGVRPGTKVFLFTGQDEEGVSTRIEDYDADWVGIVQPGYGELAEPLRTGDPVEIEIPLQGGSLFLVGLVAGRKVNRVAMLQVRVEEVGADPEVGQTREARLHFRQSLWLPLRRFAFRQDAAGDWHEVGGIVRDVSGGGLSIFADGEVPSGSTVYLDCPVPLESSGVTAYGTAVASRRVGTERRPRYIVNVRFDSLTRADRSWLAGQLHRYQWLVRWRSR